MHHVCMYVLHTQHESHVFMHSYVCMYVQCHTVCVYACMHVFMYVCMYACMHVCMYWVHTNRIHNTKVIIPVSHIKAGSFKEFLVFDPSQCSSWVRMLQGGRGIPQEIGCQHPYTIHLDAATAAAVALALRLQPQGPWKTGPIRASSLNFGKWGWDVVFWVSVSSLWCCVTHTCDRHGVTVTVTVTVTVATVLFVSSDRFYTQCCVCTYFSFVARLSRAGRTWWASAWMCRRDYDCEMECRLLSRSDFQLAP